MSNSSLTAEHANTSSSLGQSSASVRSGSSWAQSTRTNVHAMDVVWMLAWREWIRFFRQPHRVIAALGQPILLWVLFGTGLHGAFRGDGNQNFMVYYLPGTISLILLFTAIFATISIIEDRREGFLQSVLVSSSPRWTIVLGKAIGGGAIAWVQALVFLALALAVGTAPFSSAIFALIALMAVSAVGVTALGVCFAWPMDSTQGFHAIMNLVLMPLWLLSGAFFPIPSLSDGQPIGQVVMHWLMRLNPMTYPVSGMRHLLVGDTSIINSSTWSPTLASAWIVTLVTSIAAVIAATIVVRKNKIGDAQ
jgi:ABC-2 type transport system permease protein